MLVAHPLWSTTLVVISASGLALLLTAVQVRLNDVLRLTAAPRGDRWHKNPTPSSGGIAIFCAAAIAYWWWFHGEHLSIALGAAALWLLGFLDDRLRLRPAVKLIGQAAVAGAIVSSGVVCHATSSYAFNTAFSFFWLVGITNAFNLIDNMDGLCAGVTVIIAAFRFALLAIGGNWTDANLCALVGAVYAGFLILNYSPARIFMGDCGSMPAGFTLAALAIASPLPHTKVSLIGVFYPVLTFTYPIFDTMFVSILRKIARRPISVGGRDHSSHRLVSLGLRDSRVVWILWLLTALGCGIGLMVQWMPLGLIAAGGLFSVALAVFGIFLATRPGYPHFRRYPEGRRLPAPSLRIGVILILDVSLAGIALLSGFLARFGPHMLVYLPDQMRNLALSLPVIMLLHGVVSYYGTSELSWMSLRLPDVLSLARTTIVAEACACVAIWILNLESYSISVLSSTFCSVSRSPLCYAAPYPCFTRFSDVSQTIRSRAQVSHGRIDEQSMVIA